MVMCLEYGSFETVPNLVEDQNRVGNRNCLLPSPNSTTQKAGDKSDVTK